MGAPQRRQRCVPLARMEMLQKLQVWRDMFFGRIFGLDVGLDLGCNELFVRGREGKRGGFIGWVVRGVREME